MEFGILSDLDDPLVPAIRAHHGLMDRQGIEELVGEDDDRTFGDFLERAMPGGRETGGGQGLALNPLQHRADLDHVEGESGIELGHHLGRPHRIDHHCAAAGPELHQPDALGRSQRAPGRGRPQTDQLAEHLADFRRSGEIAAGAERVARRVVTVLGMGEAERHVLRDRHRTGELDAAADLRVERDDVVRAHVVRVPCRRIAIRMMPARISGNDSRIPMVSPPHK